MLSPSDKNKIKKELLKSVLSGDIRKQNNPWAICTASVGRDSDKYESCVMDVKRKLGKAEDLTEEQYTKDVDAGYAGPVPVSGLARQDLEDDSSSPTDMIGDTMEMTRKAVTKYDVTIKFETDNYGKKAKVYTVDASSSEEAKKKAQELYDREYPSQGGYFFVGFGDVISKTFTKRDIYSEIYEMVDERDSLQDNAKRISSELGLAIGYVYDRLLQLSESGKLHLRKNIGFNKGKKQARDVQEGDIIIQGTPPTAQRVNRITKPDAEHLMRINNVEYFDIELVQIQ